MAVHTYTQTLHYVGICTHSHTDTCRETYTDRDICSHTLTHTPCLKKNSASAIQLNHSNVHFNYCVDGSIWHFKFPKVV